MVCGTSSCGVGNDKISQFSDVVFTVITGSRKACLHLPHGQTEAQRGEAISPTSHSYQREMRGIEPEAA